MGREASDQRVSKLSPASPELASLVRIAARAVARGGLAHAYGHCSARIDAERFLVCPAVPMGLVRTG